MLGLNQEDEETRAAKKRASPAIGFGSSFAGGMAVFGLGGHWLDSKTGHEHLFTLIGIGLGLVYGVWEMWKLITISNQQMRDQNQADDDEDQANEPPQ